jgi:hypothetical protein
VPYAVFLLTKHTCLLDIFKLVPLTNYLCWQHCHMQQISQVATCYHYQQQQCWQGWSLDYLQSLQQHQRWQRTPPNLQIGDLVLVKEDNPSPLHWPAAMIRNLSCWGEATQHCIGLQLWSPTSIHIRWHRTRGHT